MNAWKYIKSNVDARDICAFEALAGMAFPRPVAEFLIAHNNGRPRPNGVQMPSGEEHVFEKLLSFSQGDVENVFSTFGNLQGELAPGLLPIALDPFGNYFCLDAKHGFQVVFWQHETRSAEQTGKDLFSLIDALR